MGCKVGTLKAAAGAGKGRGYMPRRKKKKGEPAETGRVRLAKILAGRTKK